MLDAKWSTKRQPVLLQSFEDEFELPKPTCKTPAEPGTRLIRGEVKVNKKDHTNYCKGVGKLIHLTKYSRPGIANAVRELSRFRSSPTQAHRKAMLRCMKYCVDTKEQGLLLKPTGRWDGKDKNCRFKIDCEKHVSECEDVASTVKRDCSTCEEECQDGGKGTEGVTANSTK